MFDTDFAEASPVETLQNQFSGYGSTPQIVARTLSHLNLKEPLEHWSNETISAVVNAFTDEKFPTVFALNKIDHPDADKNIAKIAKMQDPQSIVLCSAISEVFLRKLAKQGFARYVEGSEFVDTRDDLIEAGEPNGGGLKEMDEKLKTRIENLKDMVLYRFGSTGVVQVLSRAARLLGLVPVFPIRNVNSLGSGAAGSNAVFRDCVLVKKGSTVRDCARKIMGDAPLAYVEGAGGVRVSEDEVVEVGKNDVSGFAFKGVGVMLMVWAGFVFQGWPIGIGCIIDDSKPLHSLQSQPAKSPRALLLPNGVQLILDIFSLIIINTLSCYQKPCPKTPAGITPFRSFPLPVGVLKLCLFICGKPETKERNKKKPTTTWSCIELTQ